MTTIFQREITCPVCGTTFLIEVVGSTNQFDITTDLKPLTFGVPFYPFLVHTCPNCFYSGGEEDFNLQIDGTTADKLRAEMEFWRRKLGPVEPAPAHSYMLAAFCALILGKPRYVVGDLFLAASWCADDDSLGEFADHLREEAVEHFKSALEGDEVPRAERARVCYIIGELLRRLGKDEEARSFFERVKREVVDPAEQEWLIKGAARQISNPAQRFGEFMRGDGLD